jgi:hypothetical protein
MPALSSPFADYLASVDKILRGSPFVNDFQIQHEDRGEVWFLRVTVSNSKSEIEIFGKVVPLNKICDIAVAVI